MKKEYFGPKGLEFKSQPSQKIIFKKMTVGRESYHQVDSEKIMLQDIWKKFIAARLGEN
jgi:hypothetical protein